MAKPFVKWVGGKRQLLPDIRKYAPQGFNTLFDVFVGGGGAYFDLILGDDLFEAIPKVGVINDWNFELINCYRVIQKSPKELMQRLDELSAVADRRELFFGYRSMDPTTLDPVERAARMMFLNKNCFNGLYRVNKQGHFNTPIGKFKTPPRLYTSHDLWECHEALRNTTILHGDFEPACDTAKAGDFVYFDPPYVPLNPTSAFTSYTAEGFGKASQERLARLFERLYERGVSVMMSNSDTPLVRELYAKYTIHTIKARRAINKDASKRGAVNETLVVAIHE